MDKLELLNRLVALALLESTASSGAAPHRAEGEANSPPRGRGTESLDADGDRKKGFPWGASYALCSVCRVAFGLAGDPAPESSQK